MAQCDWLLKKTEYKYFGIKERLHDWLGTGRDQYFSTLAPSRPSPHIVAYCGRLNLPCALETIMMAAMGY